MTPHSRPRRRAVVAVMATALVLATPAVAHADDELSLSRDGVTWSPTIDDPLFDPSMSWVPGDAETATFFVRNNAPESARLDVILRVDPQDDAQQTLVEEGWVDVTVRAAEASGATIAGPGPYLVLEDAPVLAGQSVPVVVEVTFDEDAPNDTQLRAASLAFDVSLTQTGETPGEGGGGVDDGGGGSGGEGSGSGTGTDGVGGVGSGAVPTARGGLPATGADLPWWLLALSALAVGSGAALVRSRILARSTGETS